MSFALRAAILHECQNYLGGGGGLIPDARPLGTFENQVRHGIFKRSHENIGYCEQSNSVNNEKLKNTKPHRDSPSMFLVHRSTNNKPLSVGFCQCAQLWKLA